MRELVRWVPMNLAYSCWRVWRQRCNIKNRNVNCSVIGRRRLVIALNCGHRCKIVCDWTDVARVWSEHYHFWSSWADNFACDGIVDINLRFWFFLFQIMHFNLISSNLISISCSPNGDSGCTALFRREMSLVDADRNSQIARTARRVTVRFHLSGRS